MTELKSIDQVRKYLESCFASEQYRNTATKLDSGLPAVTISRQAGARGITIGDKLVSYLKENDKNAALPWTLFDKSLVKAVLKDHKLPDRLAAFMPEDKVGELKEVVGEILGLHPSLWKLKQKMTQTIFKLGRSGHVILVGRGSNIITSLLKNVIHVRLVGSPHKRVAHLCDYYDLNVKEANDFLVKEDRARKRYIKTNFDINIDDHLHYDLVINTDRLTDDSVVDMIARLVLNKKPPVD